MHPAEHLLLHQRELLPGGQLPLAGEAGEARQVVHVALGPAHPVGGVDVAAAARAAGAVAPGEGTRGHWDAAFGTQGDRGGAAQTWARRGQSTRVFIATKSASL